MNLNNEIFVWNTDGTQSKQHLELGNDTIFVREMYDSQ